MAEVLRDLQAAIDQVPPRRNTPPRPSRSHEELQRIQDGRRRGPQLLGDILPIVLARLGVGAVQSTASGEEDLRSRTRFASRERLIVPKGQTLRKAWRSLGSPTPDTAAWGHSPDVPVWRDGDRPNERGRLVRPDSDTPDPREKTVNQRFVRCAAF